MIWLADCCVLCISQYKIWTMFHILELESEQVRKKLELEKQDRQKSVVSQQCSVGTFCIN